ncbi:late embryogenesis abundant protein 18-like [Macadamia integrifolia]|uniref:late embryogenesis abundant protein 18-like n=1 Tax=Macadamia integrifolia TaxID=60698 RepID=UPI001C4ED750|nr:late embryogenesis abundant protein 18-like [Macadamia integrifolia]
MRAVKEKVSNMASAAKEHINICGAKPEEKAERAAGVDEGIAEERRKVKEAQAKMELHEAKAEHRADRLDAKQHSHLYGQHHDHLPHGQHQYPISTPGGQYPMGGASTIGAAPMTGTTGPTYPVGGYPSTTKYG